MPRTARATVVDIPHLIYQPCVPGRGAFPAERDRQQYLALLDEQAQAYKLDILAYSLLRDAVYLVGIPRRKDSLSKGVGRTHFAYTQYLNDRRRSSGPLWRNRFQSCMLDEAHLKLAVAFVERQPVEAGLVRKPERYPWSSAAAHVTGDDPTGVLALDVWPPRRSRTTWARFLSRPMEDDLASRFATHVQTGRPLGSDAFVAMLEKKLKRRLHALPVGRPPLQ